MLIRNKRFKKFLAVFFLLTLVYELGFPVAAYALTAGPTAPEATSFEPVDTTDMVNLQTGDFTYSVPLLEVPGPEGGYPLALSYHADIRPNEEATWVGLGWNLNPGAITRNVNGYPDDWKNMTQVRRDYWEGFSRTTYTIGVSIGIAGTPISAGVGVAISNDTEKGMGVGFRGTAGVDYGALNLRLSAGTYGYGETYVDASASAFGLTAGVNNNGTYASASIPVLGPGLGITLDTRGGVSYSVGGGTISIQNSKAGKIQTKSDNFGFSIPIYCFSLDLGYSYYTAWSDETETVGTYGSLYTYSALSSNYDVTGFDSYSLLDHPYHSIASSNDPTVEMGGSYPDFDNYMVTGQGLTGAMRPYFYQGHLLSQNRKDQDGNYTTKFNYMSNSAAPKTTAQFRFINDFSNQYRQTLNNYDFSSNLVAPFDANPVYGNGDGTAGYSAATNGLAGSKHISYYTNAAITAGTTTGFVNCQGFTDGFTRRNDDQIGGFSITNEQGVTYHYALPAYSKNEYIYSERIEENKGDGNSTSWNRLTKTPPYAYTWYLTSITGPDYVERDGNGIPSNGDWGYWVNFEYGKWTDAYIWRNPSEGFRRDIDNNFQDYSKGVKELYFLNAISTRTHTAVFEKAVRQDGRGEASSVSGESQNQGIFDASSLAPMALKRIYLLNSADAAAVSPATGAGYSGYLGQNVIDVNDITGAARTAIEQQSIRIIDFNQDYSLCKNTPNSFLSATPSTKTGRLTLNSIVTRGTGGVQKLPPTTFNYELTAAELQVSTATTPTATTITTQSATTYEVGDMLEFTYSGGYYYAMVSRKNAANTYTVNYVGAALPVGLSGVSIKRTKNPGYNKDAYDNWGEYKPDYDASAVRTNENLRRMTSPISARSNDVWSLRSIQTPLGAQIKMEYEPDSYSRNVLNGNGSLILTGFVNDEVNHRLTCNINTLSYPINTFFKVGDKVNILFGRWVYPYTLDNRPPECSNQPFPDAEFETFESDGWGDYMPQITAIDETNKKITFAYNPGWLFIGRSDAYECFGKNFDVPYGGNLYAYNNRETFGGGIRVKSITVTETLSGTYNRTNYSYNKRGQGALSSGATAYDPIVLDIPAVNDTRYKERFYAKINHMLTISRELPPPGVIYELVTVSNQNGKGEEINNAYGETEYQFQTFAANMIELIELSRTFGTTGGKTSSARNIALKNYTSRIGNLKRITKYNWNDEKISETIYDYMDSGMEALSITDFIAQYDTKLATIGNQGVIKERYAQWKESGGQNKIMMSAREEYPNVALGQTQIDYKTNVRTTTKNQAFDFYSGAITKKLETDAYGNNFQTEIVPAYRKYPGMGLKTTAADNKNMLTQEAASYVYKVDASNNKLGLVSANVQTWSNAIPAQTQDNTGATVVQNGSVTANGNVWRKQSNYVWMLQTTPTSDGLTPVASFAEFTWTNPAGANAAWKKGKETTLYDVYTHTLEEKDVNGNYSAVKMGYADSRVLITGGPARHKELVYSGAEDALVSGKFSGQISPGSGTVQSSSTFPVVTAHTGYNSLKVAAGAAGFSYSLPITATEANRQYAVSAWVKSSTAAAPVANVYYQVNGGAQVPANVVAARKAGDWYLLSIITPASAAVNGNTIVFGCKNAGTVDLYFDDFRVRPVNAVAAAYVYDKQTGAVTYILDNNNLFTRYEYDTEGRLTGTYRETLGNGVFKLSENQYNYGQAL